jgi:nicotinamide-nucleotide amidase
MKDFNKKQLDQISSWLKKQHQTIAVAESATAGALQFALSAAVDASMFFQGGVTVYNLGQKCKHLGVEPIHAQSVNCVSQIVATQMAQGVSALYNCDWGIGITGYASPVPESDNKVFAYYSIVFKNKVKASGKISPRMADPQELQIKYTSTVLEKLSKIL